MQEPLHAADVLDMMGSFVPATRESVLIFVNFT